MSAEQLIFGDAFARTVQRITVDAIRANTAEAWEAAAQQIVGLERLVMTIQDNVGYSDTHRPFVHLLLALGACYLRCARMADDEQARRWWAEQPRSNHDSAFRSRRARAADT